MLIKASRKDGRVLLPELAVIRAGMLLGVKLITRFSTLRLQGRTPVYSHQSWLENVVSKIIAKLGRLRLPGRVLSVCACPTKSGPCGVNAVGDEHL